MNINCSQRRLGRRKHEPRNTRMKKLTLLIILSVCVAMLNGCASNHYQQGRGDVGQFIIQQAIARGGTPVTTENLPAVSGKWSSFEDQYGIVIHLPREQFPAVESLLLLSFGQPKIKPTETSDGSKFGAYRLTAKGGGIQFMCDAKLTEVIIIRPLSGNEFSDSVMRTFQSKEFQKELGKNLKDNP